ncbi:hypothetical protein [Clostridium isatidis]|uniref:Uncharacterized protein n=1 Tax=Clostridium isatidis TaxID=182773 RepID=A0A343JCE1_9CLOT|nr:hypothetical protein [Clostridium isatidis]ASW43199.1 hypothetical protein BEN51_06810 [Clostridium isatidis]NLZ33710.1 hypothetical protein [Clostridiales bacterium]
MKNNYIYLVFSNTGTIISKLLRLCTKDNYVHVSISLDNSFSKMYSFGRLFEYFPIPGGLVEENLRSGLYRKFTKSKCIIYKININEEQYKFLKKELDKFLLNKKKYKYNLLGLLGFYINKPIKRDNYYFCSEFVSHLLIKSRIYNCDKDPALIKPSDLLKIQPKELVYEGFTNSCTLTS